MSRITALCVGVAAFTVVSTVAEAVDAAGTTMGDGACRWTNPATDTGATMDRHGIEMTMDRHRIEMTMGPRWDRD
jgi:hypothetical protein